jgi:hypothetical protein
VESDPVPPVDDDPRAARNFKDDATAYPSADEKKKDLAAAARRPKPRHTPIKPATPQPGVERGIERGIEREVERPASTSAPAKKSDTLDDLFNDTK